MRLENRFRVLAYATGTTEFEGVQYTITGRGEQTRVEHFNVAFRSRQDVMVELWCLFERRLLGLRAFTCKIEVNGVDARTISDTDELDEPARQAVESAFRALGGYLREVEAARERRANREKERKRSALEML